MKHKKCKCPAKEPFSRLFQQFQADFSEEDFKHITKCVSYTGLSALIEQNADMVYSFEAHGDGLEAPIIWGLAYKSIPLIPERAVRLLTTTDEFCSSTLSTALSKELWVSCNFDFYIVMAYSISFYPDGPDADGYTATYRNIFCKQPTYDECFFELEDLIDVLNQQVKMMYRVKMKFIGLDCGSVAVKDGYSTFGDRLAFLRKQLGFSQQDIADALHFSKSTISLYETNKTLPDAKTITTLANFFKVSCDYLLCVTDDFEK